MERINLFLLIIIALIGGIIAGNFTTGYIDNVIIDDRIVDVLDDNAAAREIASYNVKVGIEDLGVDGNGLTVLGQTRFLNGVAYEVILDDSIEVGSYQCNAILYHELGHIYLNANGLPNNEEAADDFAASRGYDITDAYHGIH